MMREHAEHGDPTERVLAACEALQRDPGQLERVAPALDAAARALQRHFDVHLEREERVIFPAIRSRLDGATQETIQAEMRARRAV
jgi:hemerythrin-like domain-containing protein